jgi:hypothetical protein
MGKDLKTMKDAALVDFGFRLKEQFDTLELQLDAVKAEARERAKKQKIDHFFGNQYFVSISPGSSTECDPQELYDAYVDMQNEKGFFSAVKVLVTKAKEDLGETNFATISEVKTFPYRSVSFKANIPKKYLKKK